MGKRKREDPSYYKKKIKKLEKKLRKLEDTTPSPSRASSQSPSPLPIQLDKENLIPIDNELPEEFLLALGHEGEEKNEVGEPIKQELTIRWAKIMTEGLGKEAKEKIMEKYPTPSNFPNTIAPQMNPEINGILSELSLKRDKRIVNRQNLTGRLLSALGRALSSIMEGNINSKILIEQINDAAKMATEIHHQDSCSRRFFALAGANKTVQDAIKTSKIDLFLFGSDCAEKIKVAQSIQRSNIQIAENSRKTSSTKLRKQLNWKGPSQNRQQQRSARGGQHQRPSYKKQPHFDRSHQKGRRHPPTTYKSSKQYH